MPRLTPRKGEKGIHWWISITDNRRASGRNEKDDGTFGERRWRLSASEKREKGWRKDRKRDREPGLSEEKRREGGGEGRRRAEGNKGNEWCRGRCFVACLTSDPVPGSGAPVTLASNEPGRKRSHHHRRDVFHSLRLPLSFSLCLTLFPSLSFFLHLMAAFLKINYVATSA